MSCSPKPKPAGARKRKATVPVRKEPVIWKVPASPTTRLIPCSKCHQTIRTYNFLHYVRKPLLFSIDLYFSVFFFCFF